MNLSTLNSSFHKSLCNHNLLFHFDLFFTFPLFKMLCGFFNQNKFKTFKSIFAKTFPPMTVVKMFECANVKYCTLLVCNVSSANSSDFAIDATNVIFLYKGALMSLISQLSIIVFCRVTYRERMSYFGSLTQSVAYSKTKPVINASAINQEAYEGCYCINQLKERAQWVQANQCNKLLKAYKS